MHLSNILSTTVAALHLLGKAQAKAVFAHYMVCFHCVTAGYDELTSIDKVGTVDEDHAQQDIDDAISVG